MVAHAHAAPSQQARSRSSDHLDIEGFALFFHLLGALLSAAGSCSPGWDSKRLAGGLRLLRPLCCSASPGSGCCSSRLARCLPSHSDFGSCTSTATAMATAGYSLLRALTSWRWGLAASAVARRSGRDAREPARERTRWAEHRSWRSWRWRCSTTCTRSWPTGCPRSPCLGIVALMVFSSPEGSTPVHRRLHRTAVH